MKISQTIISASVLVSCQFETALSFSLAGELPNPATTLPSRSNRILLSAGPSDSPEAVSTSEDSTQEKYRNKATEFLSNFVPDTDSEKNDDASDENPLSEINFEGPKISPTTTLETLVAALDYELIEKEWFVTGNVNPMYFSDDFEFQDPDVQVEGIDEYAKGVRKIFDQETSRAEILSTQINEETSTTERPIITIQWRLSGKVNVGPGLTIKPYLIDTDFVIDPTTMLVIFQEDRFSIPAWDIFLSALFPFLIGKVTSPAAPEVEQRVVQMPRISTGAPSISVPSPFDAFAKLFGK